jgi:hypothetical protein
MLRGRAVAGDVGLGASCPLLTRARGALTWP